MRRMSGVSVEWQQGGGENDGSEVRGVDVSGRTIAVNDVFLISDRKQIIAHAPFDGEWTFGEARIRSGEEVLAVRLTGYGSAQRSPPGDTCVPLVVLSPIGSWDEAAAFIRRIEASGQPICLER